MPHRGCLLFIFPLTFWIYAPLSLAHCWYLRPMANVRSLPSAKTPFARRSRLCEPDEQTKIKPHFLGLATTFPPSIILPDPGNPVMEPWRRRGIFHSFLLISVLITFWAAKAREWKTSPLSRWRLRRYTCVRASLTLGKRRNRILCPLRSTGWKLNLLRASRSRPTICARPLCELVLPSLSAALLSRIRYQWWNC